VARSLVAKLIDDHLVDGGRQAGDEIAIRIDQILHQDATGAMSFLQFEAMGLERVRPRAAYVGPRRRPLAPIERRG
jgi:aconitate hydratase